MNAVNEAALAIALRCVVAVRHRLTDKEAGEALRRFIEAARRELERLPGRGKPC